MPFKRLAQTGQWSGMHLLAHVGLISQDDSIRQSFRIRTMCIHRRGGYRERDGWAGHTPCHFGAGHHLVHA